jgi:hypothetical protein
VYRLDAEGVPREVLRVKALVHALAWANDRLLVGTGAATLALVVPLAGMASAHAGQGDGGQDPRGAVGHGPSDPNGRGNGDSGGDSATNPGSLGINGPSEIVFAIITAESRKAHNPRLLTRGGVVE